MPKIKTYDLTAREAALRVGICAETIKRYARDGRLTGRKNISGIWMFSREDVDRLPVHDVIEQVA